MEEMAPTARSWSWALSAGRPVIRLGSNRVLEVGAPEVLPAPDARHWTTAGTWRSMRPLQGATHWRSEGDAIALEARVTTVTDSTLTLSVVVRIISGGITGVGLPLRFSVIHAEYLDDSYGLRPLDETAAKAVGIHSPKLLTGDLLGDADDQEGSATRVVLCIDDFHSSIGLGSRSAVPDAHWRLFDGRQMPQVRYASGVRSERPAAAGGVIAAELSLTRAIGATAFAVAHRLPGSYQAALSITDHADYDDAAVLRRLLAKKRAAADADESCIPITKSFFVSSPNPKRAAGDKRSGLLTVADLIERAGGEVALHTNSSEESTRPVVESDLRVWPYSTRTWIDHSPYNRQNVSGLGAMEGSKFFVLDLLCAHGLSSVWSFVDVNVNPVGSIGMTELRGEAVVSLVRRLAASLRSSSAGPLAGAAHATMDWLESRRGIGDRYSLKMAIHFLHGSHPSSGRTVAVRVVQSVRKLVRFVRGCVLAFLPQRQRDYNVAVMWLSAELSRYSDVWAFTTVRVTNLCDVYSPSSISSLIDEHGIHVGHTYLAADRPYMAGRAHLGGGEINPAWDGCTDAMLQGRAEGALWVTTLNDLSRFWRSLAGLSVRRLGPTSLELRSSDREGGGLSMKVIIVDIGGGPTGALECVADGESLPLRRLRDGKPYVSVDVSGKTSLELQSHAY